MQRRELGPMFHEFSHLVYDRTETLLLQEEMPPVGKISELEEFTKGVNNSVTQVSQELLDEQPVHHQIVEYMGEKRSLPYRDIGYHFKLTTIAETNVMKEALRSGVFIPIKMALLTDMVEHSAEEAFVADQVLHKVHAVDEVFSDPSRIVEIMRRPEFSHMVHALAHAPNGFLGGSSVTSQLYDIGYFRFLTAAPVDYDVRSHFVFDADKRVVDWSPEFYDEKSDDLHKYNQSHKAEASGGCPVRHADFSVIGEAATRYLHDLGNADGQVSVKGESMIDRSLRMMSTLLEAAIAQDSSDQATK